MKIKSRPQDFIVEEILAVTPQSSGEYHLYRVEKRGLNTTDLVPRIADAFDVPAGDIAYGGRKDKHALATQHVSIHGRRPLPKTLEKQNFKLDLIGFLDRPMGPDLIEKNCFALTIRDLGADQTRLALLELVKAKTFGYPNYFDDQRFGSFDKRQGWLAEKILKKHDNGAVKIYITRFESRDDRKEQARKEKLISLWGDWDACLKIAGKDFEKFAFRHLKDKPKDFRFILRRIPRDELSGFFTAFQAYLWNEVLRRFLRQHFTNLLVAAGSLAPYYFYDKLEEKEEEALKKMVIPLPAGTIPQDPVDVRAAFESLFSELELKSSMFNLKTIRHAFFKAVPRPAIVIPADCRHDVEADEINPGREKILLSFTLPRGSYATMFVKRIFSARA